MTIEDERDRRVSQAVISAAGPGAHSSVICGWRGTFGNGTCEAVHRIVGGAEICREDPKGLYYPKTIAEVQKSARREFGGGSESHKHYRGQFGIEEEV